MFLIIAFIFLSLTICFSQEKKLEVNFLFEIQTDSLRLYNDFQVMHGKFYFIDEKKGRFLVFDNGMFEKEISFLPRLDYSNYNFLGFFVTGFAGDGESVYLSYYLFPMNKQYLIRLKNEKIDTLMSMSSDKILIKSIKNIYKNRGEPTGVIVCYNDSTQVILRDCDCIKTVNIINPIWVKYGFLHNKDTLLIIGLTYSYLPIVGVATSYVIMMLNLQRPNDYTFLLYYTPLFRMSLENISADFVENSISKFFSFTLVSDNTIQIYTFDFYSMGIKYIDIIEVEDSVVSSDIIWFNDNILISAAMTAGKSIEVFYVFHGKLLGIYKFFSTGGKDFVFNKYKGTMFLLIDIGVIRRIYKIEEKFIKVYNFALYQNYPNPFNSTTTIEFDIPERTNVKLVIYDILGREVETLIDKELEPGKHKINFNATNLPSGVYFYTLRTPEFTKTNKMLLIK
jgi:hypothetical protein